MAADGAGLQWTCATQVVALKLRRSAQAGTYGSDFTAVKPILKQVSCRWCYHPDLQGFSA